MRAAVIIITINTVLLQLLLLCDQKYRTNKIDSSFEFR